MDTHTLELLEFDKIRTLVAARAACSLGKVGAVRLIEPEHRSRRDSRPSGTYDGDGRGQLGLEAALRRPARHPPSCAAGSKESGSRPRSSPRRSRRSERSATSAEWLARVGEQFPRLGGLRQEVGEFSGVAVAIEGCLDNRGKVLDTASRRLSALRRDIGRAQERIQETLRQMLRSPEIRRILRFANFSMVGHHYVLPVAKDHRGEVQGSVLRTSASNETVYIEPTVISEQSAQLLVPPRAGDKGGAPDLALALRPGRYGSRGLVGTLDTMAELDLIHARARLSIDYRMSGASFQSRGEAGAARPPASPSGSTLSRRSRDRRHAIAARGRPRRAGAGGDR